MLIHIFLFIFFFFFLAMFFIGLDVARSDKTYKSIITALVFLLLAFGLAVVEYFI